MELLVGKCEEKRKELYVSVVDLNKMCRDDLWEVLNEQGDGDPLVQRLKSLYDGYMELEGGDQVKIYRDTENNNNNNNK